MRSSRPLIAAGAVALAVALAPAPAAAQAPGCLPAGERIPEPTRDGYGLGPLLPAPTCPPGDRGGAPAGARLPPLASTPGGPVGGGPQGSDGEIGGGTPGGGPGGGGPPGADPSGPGGPTQVLGDVLNGDEGPSGGTLPAIPPSEPAWTGPLAGAQGLSPLDLAVGAGLLLALITVGARLARPSHATL
ncbi:MAG: hypothetical protein MSC31_17395 [Solirubrobacteraceae bacterium MAG38_C4-C5]|nr:hypothetical protein [Candidatus Siliceabacter maunaloa]